MKKIAVVFALFLFCSISYNAQDIKPSPTPPDEGGVVKISTNLIQIDVSVTDKKGNAIRDLRPEDFEIFENGEKQSISNFRFVSSVRQTETPVKQIADKTAIPIPPIAIRPEQVRRTFALVVDDLAFDIRRLAERQPVPGADALVGVVVAHDHRGQRRW